MRRKILFVHENPSVLVRLAAHLDSKPGEWEAAYAQNAAEAETCLSEEACDVVFAGGATESICVTELLDRIAEISPDAVRIVLTNPEDEDGLIRRVSRAHQFLAESCEPEDLHETLQRASRVRDLLDEPGLKQLISQIERLPSLPTLYAQIVNELRSSEPSIARVARTICDDMSMAAKTIQMVKTISYAPRSKINDPMRASIYLGIDMLKALVLSARVFAQFERVHVAELTVGSLWEHSLRVATLAQQIARHEQLEKTEIDDAFLSGVLHDVGKLILAMHAPDSYVKACRMAREDEISIADAERIVFGATHAEVGGYLMALWGLSDSVVRGIQFHHEPSRAAIDALDCVTIVHAANAFANG